MNKEAATKPLPKGYYFLTPVWGEVYTRFFIEMAIPSQLSPNNLPAFSDSANSRYVIFTTAEDAVTIRNAPIFALLSQTIAVHIEVIARDETNDHSLMSQSHHRGIVMADEADAATILLNPDILVADGSFRSLRRLAEAGHNVILTTGLRTFKQAVTREVSPCRTADGALNIPPRTLMRATLNHMHSLAHSSWWEEGDDYLMPANLYWRVGDEGLVAHCFHLHPLLVYPQRKGATFLSTIDDDYVAASCPDDRYDYVVTDSDELLIIELSDPGRTFNTGLRKGSVEDAVIWAEQSTSARHRKFVVPAIRMHTGIHDRAAWDTAMQRARGVVNAMLSRLTIPTWRLAFTNRIAFQKRLLRLSQELELRRANRHHFGDSGLLTPRLEVSLSRYQMRVGMFVSSIVSYIPKLLIEIREFPLLVFSRYVRLVRQIKSFLIRLQRRLFGRPWWPRPWVWRYHYLVALRRDMMHALQAAHGDTLLIAPHPALSFAAFFLGKNAGAGMFVHEGDAPKIIDMRTATLAATQSYDTVVLDRALFHSRRFDAVLSELKRVLKPSGTLILLVNRVPFTNDSSIDHELLLGAPSIAHLLSSDFKIETLRKQGSFAQGILYALLDWIQMQSRRLHLPFVLMVLLLALAALFNFVFGLLVNTIIFMLDRLDSSHRFYISTIVTATKRDTAS